MPTDPRYVIRTLFDPFFGACDVHAPNLLEEDGVTEAVFEATYEYNPVVLQRIMLESPTNLDVNFIISLIGEEPPDMSPSGPICYNHILGVQPVTITKYNSDGTVKVNGDKLGLAATDEIKRIIRTNPLGSLRNVQRRNENVERIGSHLIYGDITELSYKQYATHISAAAGVGGGGDDGTGANGYGTEGDYTTWTFKWESGIPPGWTNADFIDYDSHFIRDESIALINNATDVYEVSVADGSMNTRAGVMVGAAGENDMMYHHSIYGEYAVSVDNSLLTIWRHGAIIDTIAYDIAGDWFGGVCMSWSGHYIIALYHDASDNDNKLRCYEGT